jgi:hypothetical protein
LSFKEVPPDTNEKKLKEKESVEDDRGQKLSGRDPPATTVIEEPEKEVIQMSSSTAASVAKLKEIMQGKSKNNEAKQAQKIELKRRLEETKRQIEQKRLKLEALIVAKEREEKRVRSSSDPATEPSTDIAGIHHYRTTVALPPQPSLVQIPKPEGSHPTGCDLPIIIASLLQSTSKLEEPVFKFTVSDESATFNMNLLRQNNFDLEELLNRTKSVTSYGSEFKSVEELTPLLQRHPRWTELKKKLSEGAIFPTKELEESTRIQDLRAMKQRGNHKSARTHEDHLAVAFTKEVEKGWNLILPESEAFNIPHLELAPMGVADQLGISATGEFVSKLRVTHDLSFAQAVSGESLNSRVNKEELEPCMFGHTLLRLVHHIVYLRSKYPTKKIWLRKEDFKSAYRRMHLNAKTAFQTSVRVKLKGKFYILVSLRLPFGGSPCPSDFCLISDVITDTINDLLACDDWDPREIKSDYVEKIPEPRPLPDNIPYAQARDLSVSLDDQPSAKADCFVDDIMSITVDEGDNLLRLATAPCTVIHAIGHSATGETHLKRQDLISEEKNVAEGAPEEEKICLGWTFNTRRLTVALPSHKYEAWDNQVKNIISAKSIKFKLLESILGRLENVAIIVVMFGHFLNNIRSLQIKAMATQHNQKLSKNAIREFELSRKFLARAHRGVSMNNIVFRKPTRIYIGDASEHGLGGMCVQSGKAWRFLIPPKLRGRAHINLLEFLIQVVSIWIDIHQANVKEHDCLLAMGDNTTAAGWCKRTNFREKTEGDQEWIVKQQVARKLANLVLDSDSVLYTQWFKGSWNLVTDSLSRDVHFLSPDLHAKFLHKTVPKQLPPNFQIAALPEEISSFITSTLRQLPVKKQRLKPQKISELALSKLGRLSSAELGSQDPCIWMDLTLSRNISSLLPSLTPFEPVPSLQEITQVWWKAQSKPPSHMWRRPLGQTTGLTRDWTQTARPVSCSTNCQEPTEIKTSQERNKRPSP